MDKRLLIQDGHLLAVFNSAHRVMKAESRLKALNLPVLLIPAPRQLQADCGLAIRFHDTDRVTIMDALEREKLLPDFVALFNSGKFDTIWNSAGHAEPDG